MNLRLNKLTLKNFRGIGSLTIEPGGKSCTVSGDNELGKTTLGDGLHWLFTDKDMQGRSPSKAKVTSATFPLKPLDGSGNEIHHLECTVEAEFNKDGETLVLKKVFKEIHTKPRGGAKKVFSGNTNNFYIDGVEKTAANFKIALAEIAGADVILMLLTPFYFAAGLDWKKRREIVLDISGDVDDADVIANNKDLAELPAILGSKSVSDKMAEVKAAKTKINGQIDDIPIRIDENSRKQPDISGLDHELVSKEPIRIKKEIDTKDKELAKVEAGGADAALVKRLAEAEAKLSAHQTTADNFLANLIRVKGDELAGIGRTQNNAASQIITLTNLKTGHETAVKDAGEKLKVLNGDYDSVYNSSFTPEEGITCGTCTQVIPYDLQKIAFNLRKKTQLEEMNVKGKALTNAKNQGIRSTEVDTGLISDQQAIVDTQKGLHKTCETELFTLEETKANPEVVENYAADLEEKNQIEADIKKADAGDTTDLKAKIDQELETLRADLKIAEDKVKLLLDYDLTDKRNGELREEEKMLSGEFETLEGQLFLMEEFTRTKVSMLNEGIQAKFPGIEFKLFSDAINGGLDECCEVMVEGVPYGGANTASRIKKGLGIVKTLSEHHDVWMPVLIDNAEAVIDFDPVPMQLIRMAASKDKEIICKTD